MPPRPSPLHRTFCLPALAACLPALAALFAAVAHAAPPVPPTPPAPAPSKPQLPANPREQLRTELDDLLKLATQRPYGLVLPGPDRRPAAPPGPSSDKRPVPVSFEPGQLPAAGLVLLLGYERLNDPRYLTAAVQLGRSIALATESTGRIPPAALSLPNAFSQKQSQAEGPSRPGTTASLAFLILLNERLTTPDERLTTTAIRSANWLVREQLRNGVLLTSVKAPDDRYPRRIIRLDTPDWRDFMLSMMLLSTSPEDSKLPTDNAARALARGADQLLRLRFNEPGKPNRYLWPTALTAESNPIPPRDAGGIPGGSAANFLATRFACQALLAYCSTSPRLTPPDPGDPERRAASLEAVRLATEAAALHRGDDTLWPLVLDPDGFYPPPASDQPDPGTENPAAASWRRSSYGLPELFKTQRDVKVLSSATFAKVTNRTLPARLHLAAMLTGLTDHLLTADLPLSAAQLEPYFTDHPELLSPLAAPPGNDIQTRVERCWALYLLSLWQDRFAAPRP